MIKPSLRILAHAANRCSITARTREHRDPAILRLRGSPLCLPSRATSMIFSPGADTHINSPHIMHAHSPFLDGTNPSGLTDNLPRYRACGTNDKTRCISRQTQARFQAYVHATEVTHGSIPCSISVDVTRCLVGLRLYQAKQNHGLLLFLPVGPAQVPQEVCPLPSKSASFLIDQSAFLQAQAKSGLPRGTLLDSACAKVALPGSPRLSAATHEVHNHPCSSGAA